MKKIEDYKNANPRVAIHCKNEKEWNKISELINYKFSKKYDQDDCIYIDSRTWSTLDYSKYNKHTIYPASDFLEEEIPEYIECIKLLGDCKIGGIFKTKNLGHKIEFLYTVDNSKCNLGYIDNNDDWDSIGNLETTLKYFKASTKEEYNLQNKPKFQVDKWYKAVSRDINYYLKFSRLEKVTDYNRLYGSTINTSSALNKYNESGTWANSNFERQALENGPLTDLLEIQEFLPDGHPDKIVKSVNNELTINNLIKDKIYVIEGTTRNPTNKFIKKGNGQHICIDTKYYYNGNHLFNDNSTPLNIILATSEEIEHLNQCIKANKYVEYDKQMEINEFKKGDYIVVLNDKDSRSWENYCLLAKENKKHLSVSIDPNGGPGCWWNKSFEDKSHWRYATKEEIAEYDRLGKPFDISTLNKVEVKMIREKILEKANLVGRYVKSLQEQRFYNVQLNEYLLIKKDDNSILLLDKYGLASHPNDIKGAFTEYWELMPIDFKPETKSEINSNDFVLPERWCIKRVGEENSKLINNYFNKGVNKDDAYITLDDRWYLHFPNHQDFTEFKYGCHLNNTLKQGYTEITFEQFKTHVLKENNKPKVTRKIGSVSWNEPRYIIGIDPITEKPTLIKSINKIEVKIKKVTSQPVKKERKQLIIIKTKQLKLN